MSSWTEGERAPLLPPAAQAFLKRRGAELTGFGCLVLGLALVAALVSYQPDDPSWMNATSSAPRNWLGAPGALIADPLLQTLGLAAWGLPVALIVWAFRLMLHRGDERAWSRMILIPAALLVGAVFASSHAPHDGWTLPAGLGGVIGDGALSMLLSAMPISAAEAIKPVSLALAGATVLLSGFSLGVTWPEAVDAFHFLLRSLIAALVTMVTILARAGFAALTLLRDVMAKPRSKKHAPPKPIGRDRREPSIDGEAGEVGDAPPLEGESVLPTILRRATAPVERPTPKPLKKSRTAVAEEQPRLALDETAEGDAFIPPALSLLQNPAKIVRHRESDAALDQNARMLESVLDDYGVRGEIGAIRPGPVVTMYELEPAPGLKASRVIGLSDDIARSMSALAARVSTIPGRNVIGIELPNNNREMVLLREMLSSGIYGDSSYRLALALGKDIGGEPVIANLAKMPHLLVAGTTGSGKSVAINTMILSLLYRLSPKECRLIMIDPKMLELSVYDGIPHLLSPVVTDPKKSGRCAEMGGGGDGEPLQEDVEDGRAQHRRLQCPRSRRAR